MTTVIVLFEAAEGQVGALRDALQSGQPNVIAAGAQHIALYTDQDNPNVVVEIERWPSSDGHKAMMAKMEADGVLEQMGPLIANFTVHYLDEVAATSA